jgi:hypothetical protein
VRRSTLHYSAAQPQGEAMDKDIAMRWADYLEQPGLKQAKCKLDDGKGGKCCLGHLCDMLQVPRRVEDGEVFYGESIDDEEKIVLPRTVVTKCGMRTASGYYTESWDLPTGYYTESRDLTISNDIGCTLREIAAIIRANWERL